QVDILSKIRIDDTAVALDTDAAAHYTEQEPGAVVREEVQGEIAVLASFKEDIDEDLQRLAAALRLKDQSAIDRAHARLEELKLLIQDSLGEDYDEDTLLELLNAYIDDAIERTEENVLRIEKVI